MTEVNMLNFEVSGRKYRVPKVVKVISPSQVIISAGKNDSISYNDKFDLFEIGEELFHPDTNDSLGRYELKKGQGKIVHVMDKMSVLEFQASTSIEAMFNGTKVSGFKNPKIGDEARKEELPF
ncbi:hypothetical protein [Vreelandella sp. EE22]